MIDLFKLAESYGDKCPKQLKVMVYVLCHADYDAYVYASYAKIAKETGVSVDTVVKTMKLMAETGAIIRVENGVWRLNPEHSERITYEELCAMPEEEAAKYFVTPIL